MYRMAFTAVSVDMLEWVALISQRILALIMVTLGQTPTMPCPFLTPPMMPAAVAP